MVDAPKRYSIFVPSGYAEISERSEGEWVCYSDYARLQEQLEAVTRERDEAKQAAFLENAERKSAISIARAAEARAARLEAALREHVTENVWNAYHIGIEAGGRWMDGARSEGEWLASDLGLSDGWHDAETVRAMLPDLVDRIVARTALDVKEAG